MTSKLRLLIGLNVVLMAAVAVSALYRPSRGAFQSGQATLAFADTTLVTRLILGTDTIEKAGPEEWLLNGRITVAPSKIRLLLAVLPRIEAQRPLTGQAAEQARQLIAEKGIRVEVYGAGGLLHQMQLVGTENGTIGQGSQTEPYRLQVPGYAIDLAQVFRPHPTEWRDRRLVPADWRTLRTFQVSYPADTVNSFLIRFERGFLGVEGVAEPDTTILFSYLQRLQNFQAAAFVEDAAIADSISRRTPFATLAFRDIFDRKDLTLEIFPARSAIYGRIQPSGQLVVIEQKALENVLVSRALFQRKERRR